MTTLSAFEAISPAVERTKQYLFRPFRWGRFLKLTVVAALTEGGITSCNFHSSLPTGHAGGWNPHIHMPHLEWPLMPVLIGLLIGIALFTIAMGIAISYLLIRLRFSYFDCLLRGQDRIGPAWGRYHSQTMRYLGLSVCLGAAYWAVLAFAGYRVYLHFKPLFEALGSDRNPNLSDILALIAVALPVLVLTGLAFALARVALSAFVLPRMALEDASIADAVGEVWNDIVEEPWQYLLFVVLRFVLSLVATIIAFILMAIPIAILVVIGVALFLILKSASTGVAILLGVAAGILLLGLLLLTIMAMSGTIGTLRRNYALLFYGGRYPLLGNILAPPPPPAWEPGRIPRMDGGV